MVRKNRFLSAILLTGTLALALPIVRAARADDETAATLLAKGQETERSSAEEACPVYLRLLEKFPKDDLAPRARLRLGICLKKLGRTEDARARLREARATGKNDGQLCHEAELALMDLPPEPPAKADGGEKAPAPPKAETPPPPPAPKDPPKPAPAPEKPAELDERGKLQAEIAAAEKEKQDLIKKAQDLEDAGRTEESYATRAQADKKLVEIDELKKKLKALPPPKPQRPAPPPGGEKPKDAPPPDPAQQRKMMERRKEELEKTAKAAEARAAEAKAAGKADVAAIAQQEADKARADIAAIQKRIDALPAAAAQPAPPKEDPNAKKEADLRNALERAKAAEKEAKGDEAQKKAHDEVAQREKDLNAFLAEREAANQKLRLDRFAEQMKRRGLPQWEIDERLAFAKTEYALQQKHEEKLAALTRELKDKNVSPDEQKAKIQALDKADRAELDKQKGDEEAKILTIAKSELEKELQKRAADLRAQGVAAHEIDVKVVEWRKELEAKLPGKRDENKSVGVKDNEKHAALEKENQKLRSRVEELEKEIAKLEQELAKLKKDAGSTGATPTQATSNSPK